MLLVLLNCSFCSLSPVSGEVLKCEKAQVNFFLVRNSNLAV